MSVVRLLLVLLVLYLAVDFIEPLFGAVQVADESITTAVARAHSREAFEAPGVPPVTEGSRIEPMPVLHGSCSLNGVAADRRTARPPDRCLPRRSPPASDSEDD